MGKDGTYSFVIVAILICIYFIPGLVYGLIKWLAQCHRYRDILKRNSLKVKNINVGEYRSGLEECERIFGTYKDSKVILKDRKGTPINICSKCGGYMRVVRGWRGRFLGCSNYPKCKSSQSCDRIFDMEI
jgi:hypothetical protein